MPETGGRPSRERRSEPRAALLVKPSRLSLRAGLDVLAAVMEVEQFQVLPATAVEEQVVGKTGDPLLANSLQGADAPRRTTRP